MTLRRRTWIALSGGSLAALTAVALLAVFVVVPWWRTSSPEWLAETAIRRLDSVPALHYRGTFVDHAGRVVRLDAQVGGDNRAVGWQEIDGHRAEFVASRANTYVRADAAYWNISRPSRAGIYAGRWVSTGLGELRAPLFPALLPSGLKATLRAAFLVGDRELSKAGRRITASDRGALSVTAEAPYRLTRVEGAMVVDVRGSAPRNYVFDVTEPSGAEIDAFEARFATLSTVMAGAINPDNDVALPAFYNLDEYLDREACDDTSCRLDFMVKKYYGPDLPGSRPSLIAVIKADKAGLGPALGRCEARVPATAPGRPAKVSCVVRDPRWTQWWRTSNRDSRYFMRGIVTNPGWDGSVAGVVAKLLEGRADTDDIYVVQHAAGGLGLKVFASLLQYPGMTSIDAVTAVKQAAKFGQLDVVGAYVGNGRLGNPAAFTKFLAELPVSVVHERSPFAEVWQLHEAAARASSGTGPVALSSWTPPAAKKPLGSADLIDTGRKEALQLESVGQPAGSAVVDAITRTAGEFDRAPAGYRHVAQIHVASSRNPLRTLGKSALRDALAKLGLKPAALKDVQRLVVVNGTGRHTFAPADFR